MIAVVFALALAPGAPMHISSTAFTDQGAIPAQYTCDGGDAFPPLSFGDVPADAKSLALIVDDPDAPKKTWVHAVVLSLPPSTTSLPDGMTRLPAGARIGVNDWKKAAWGGPCPPSGTHRYFFKLYALDVDAQDWGAPTKDALVDKMKGHVLAEAQLVGTYAKRR